MTGTRINRRATALATVVVGLWLVMPTPAAGKFTHELRIGEAVSIQGTISPTLFAGRPCVEVVPRVRGDSSERTHSGAGFVEIEAEREYWMLVVFNGDQRLAEEPRRSLDQPLPSLLLRNLDTGASVRTEAKAMKVMFGGRAGAYADLSVRFPSPGPWSVAIIDGMRSFELSSGRVFASGAGPDAQPATPSELVRTLGPTPDLDPAACATAAPRATPAATSTLGPPVAIAGAVVLIAGASLLVRRRRRGAHPG